MSLNTFLSTVANFVVILGVKFCDTLFFCLRQTEMSHRSADFNNILNKTKNLLRELL